MYNTWPPVANSEILPTEIKKIFTSFVNNEYPSGINKLAVSGDDLMKLGLKGKQVGDALKLVLIAIYSNKLKNNKNDILKFVEKQNTT